tara:strand:- start:3180 stop:5096 length:1917 start_codon:yes stop_codon:yes gene_type:complete
MSFMNRKMFNRNARNKLNAMGGVASFQLGGSPLMATNPLTKSRGSRGIPTSGIGAVQDINPELINLLGITRPRAPGRGGGISGLSLKEMPLRPQGVMENIFQPESTLQSAQAQSMMGGSPLSTGVSPGFQQAVTGSPVGAPSQDKLLDVFKQISGAPNPLDTLKDQERMQQGQISPVLQEQRDVAEEENLIAGDDPDKKKIIKPDPVKPTITEEQQKILDDQKRRQEGQLGTISIKNEEEVKKIVKEGTPEEQQAELKQLMQEFTQNAPKYEGMDKNLALAKMFFSVAAGDSPDAVTNIAKGLEKGADAFIKDKAKKDEFNRQVQLSALQYGLGEIGKNKAFERQKALSTFNKQFDFEKYIVGPEGFTDERGNTYAEGDEVTISKAFLAENGTPPGLTSTSFAKALLEKQAANTKAFRKARENMTVKDLAKTDKYIENYSKATTGMLEASNGIKLTKGFMLDVAGGKVTGFNPAFQSLWSRASAVLGKDAPKSYTDRDVAVADMKKVFQQLIPLTLGRDQSANSISDRDVSFLADAFVTKEVMQGGVFALTAMPKELLLDKGRKIIERFQTAQIENASKLNAYDAQAQEFILPSGKSIGTLVESERKRLGKDLPTFKKGQKYSRGEDGVIKLVTVKDN